MRARSACRHVHGASTVQLWVGPKENSIRMEGVIREADAGTWLDPLMDEIHRTALRAALDEVILDIRRLEYANAVVWRCLVQWIRRMRELRDAYRIVILSDPNRHWQAVGAPALRTFSLDATGTERLILKAGYS